MYQFLSDEWFAKVLQINEATGDLNLTPAMQETLNFSLTDGESQSLHIKHGKIYQGFSNDAVASISTNKQILKAIIANKDIHVAIEAFMTGQLRIDGDVSKILHLQSAHPTLEQKALYQKILAITSFD